MMSEILKSLPFYTHFTAASDRCVSDYYPNYREAFEYTGAVSCSKLGNVSVVVCDCRKMTDTCRESGRKQTTVFVSRMNRFPEICMKKTADRPERNMFRGIPFASANGLFAITEGQVPDERTIAEMRLCCDFIRVNEERHGHPGGGFEPGGVSACAKLVK